MTDRSADWAARRRAWESGRLGPALERAPERRARFSTISDVPIDALYGPWSSSDPAADPLRDIGFPGEPPFTRGIHPTGYRGRLWTMRMFAGFGAAEDTNARFRQLLAAGQTGLSIAYDMPTLYGYDSDDPEAEGEFGTCGVGVSSLADMEVLLSGLPLDQVSTSMTINSPAAPIWAMYIVAAEKAGVPRARLEGTTQNDILKEFVAQKEFLFPPLPSMRLVTDTIEFGTREMPRWNTVSISGYHIREAGSTAVQELAFTIADGIAYVEAALARGLAIDDFAPRLSFFFNSHSDFFEEIAKFRASRRIWYRLMTERFGAANERSTWMRFHTQTAGVSLTPQQPLNNLTRVALQALAAVLGGTQSLHTDAYDEALAVPTAEAAMLALRQQQIIAEETGVDATVDPLGGSWFVEALTDETETAVWRYLDEIDRRGGMVAAITEGYPQHEIADAAYRYQREFDAGDRRVVGTNAYMDETERTRIPVLSVPPGSEERHLARLARTRRERDAGAVECSVARSARDGGAPGVERDEPHAAFHPMRGGVRHPWRAMRGPARGLRGVPRTGRGLTSGLGGGQGCEHAVREPEGLGQRHAGPIESQRTRDLRLGREAATEHDRDPVGRIGRTNRSHGLGDGRDARRAGCRERDEFRVVASDVAPEIGCGDIGAKVGHCPAPLAEQVVKADQADHVVLAGGACQYGQRPDPAFRPKVRPELFKRSKEGLAGQMLLGHTPFAGSPALAHDAHGVRDKAVVDFGARRIREGVADRPGSEIVVAVDEETGQQLRAVGTVDAFVRSGHVDGWQGRGVLLLVHRQTLPSCPQVERVPCRHVHRLA